MERSDELRDLFLRCYEAPSAGDVDVLDRCMSREGAVRVIGTDPQEWWVGIPGTLNGDAVVAGGGARGAI
jgi:ketosteroid isomerase-like protein